MAGRPVFYGPSLLADSLGSRKIFRTAILRGARKVTGSPELHDMIVRALERTTGDLKDLADEIGVSYHTLWSWKAGRRTPGPEHVRTLADALEARGGELTELARELREAAGEGGD